MNEVKGLEFREFYRPGLMTLLAFPGVELEQVAEKLKSLAITLKIKERWDKGHKAWNRRVQISCGKRTILFTYLLPDEIKKHEKECWDIAWEAEHLMMSQAIEKESLEVMLKPDEILERSGYIRPEKGFPKYLMDRVYKILCIWKDGLLTVKEG